jgi:hypothetical protein
VETINELKTELAALKDVLESSDNPSSELDWSNSKWFQLVEAHNKLPNLVAMLQSVVDHLDQLERNSQMHRQLAHQHQRNGTASMSMRALLLANHEDRLREALLMRLSEAWNSQDIKELTGHQGTGSGELRT